MHIRNPRIVSSTVTVTTATATNPTAGTSTSTGITITFTSMTSNTACIITTTTVPAMISTYYIQSRNFIEDNGTRILH